MYVIYKYVYKGGLDAKRFCRWGTQSKKFGAVTTLGHLPKLEKTLVSQKFWSDHSQSHQGGFQVTLRQTHTGQSSLRTHHISHSPTLLGPHGRWCLLAPEVYSRYEPPSATLLSAKKILVYTQ